MTVLPSAMRPTRRVLQRVGPGGNNGRRSIAYFISAPVEGFVFCFPGTAQSRAEEANALPGGRNAPSRSRRQGRAVCVHWSEAKALDGGSGRPRRRLLSGREDREVNDDGAKQQKRPRLCAGAESGLQSERSLVELRRWLRGSSSCSLRSSLRTTSARMDHDVIFVVFDSLPLPLGYSWVELTREPSTNPRQLTNLILNSIRCC